ncbi:MAG TPA: sigma-70 family RNA polymerase sigma factor [Thermoanaerobaculia bacterium]|jgi:RNA polymerase sigma factor (sigma-70 family)|nr:sigma-70 family RNA polymerase sigma factor [Thermoanaerobaculia bacterium]
MSVAPFPTTRRSVVLALVSADAAERTRAFETLVACYWKPLYKYARVAWSRKREDAEDLTQSFFTRAFEKESLASYDPTKASFRTFLRLLFDRHVSNEWKAGQRIKRGGGEVHLDFDAAEAEIGRDASTVTPEEYFHREWVRSMFTLAVERLRAHCAADGKEIQFAIFEAYDLDDDRGVSYRELAVRFDVPETQVTNFLSATRRRFREIVLEALREVTATDAEFRNESRALLGGKS